VRRHRHIQTQIKVSIVSPIWKCSVLNQENNGSVFLSSVLEPPQGLLPQTSTIPILPQVMTLSFLPNNAFPLPASIVPKLVALGLDDKTAAKVSKVYLSSALTLKGMLETEYTNACNALLAASDNRGYSSKELRVKLLTVSITRYMQALSKCLDESIEKAEASLLRRNTKRASQFKVDPHLWFLRINVNILRR